MSNYRESSSTAIASPQRGKDNRCRQLAQREGSGEGGIGQQLWEVPGKPDRSDNLRREQRCVGLQQSIQEPGAPAQFLEQPYHEDVEGEETKQ